MTKGPIKNVAASIRQRLTNIATASHRPFSELLQYYAQERWLFRLSQSSFHERFILKGALLFVIWKTPATRPTRDIDLLGRLPNELDSVRAVIASVCEVDVEDDGLRFDPGTVVTQRIAEAAEYQGVRATFSGTLGNARIAMQIDIGFSDVITPAAITIRYPTILNLPAARLLAYNRETAIAEKFEAMVKLGALNSRMKDFFDVAVLAANFSFEGAALAAAIRATFAQRETAIDANATCFSSEFMSDRAKAAQWQAFVRRSMISTDTDFLQVVQEVRSFLQPIAAKLAINERFGLDWQPNGPWR